MIAHHAIANDRHIERQMTNGNVIDSRDVVFFTGKDQSLLQALRANVIILFHNQMACLLSVDNISNQQTTPPQILSKNQQEPSYGF